MKLSSQTKSLLYATIKKAVDKYICGNDGNVVTDIHLQANPVSGDLLIFDDDDNLLAEASIDEWVACEDDNFEQETIKSLTTILTQMNKEGVFDRLAILKPYSFVLIDEEKETLAELLLIDDDTLVINDELLKGLDEELNQFLKDLLEK